MDVETQQEQPICCSSSSGSVPGRLTCGLCPSVEVMALSKQPRVPETAPSRLWQATTLGLCMLHYPFLYLLSNVSGNPMNLSVLPGL